MINRITVFDWLSIQISYSCICLVGLWWLNITVDFSTRPTGKKKKTELVQYDPFQICTSFYTNTFFSFIVIVLFSSIIFYFCFGLKNLDFRLNTT